MAHRTFRDEFGREWDAWEVVPTAVERRMARNTPSARPGPIERRTVQETRVLVPESLQRGWLAFQSGTDRRRLAPIPAGWEEMTANQLIELLHRAENRSRSRRLIE